MEKEQLEKQVEKLTETVAQLLKRANHDTGRIAGLEQSMRITDAYIGDFKKKISDLEDQLRRSSSSRTLR